MLPLFEQERPKDPRPRRAIEAIRAWAKGKRKLGMAEVRRLSLGSHAAARACKTAAAQFAARAAGHAVAIWHAPAHAMGVPIYACMAILASLDLPLQNKDLRRKSPMALARAIRPRGKSAALPAGPQAGRSRHPGRARAEEHPNRH